MAPLPQTKEWCTKEMLREPGSSTRTARTYQRSAVDDGPTTGNRKEDIEPRFRKICWCVYSLTKLCLEGFLLSDSKGRAMVPTPKLEPKAKNKIRRICGSTIHRILFYALVLPDRKSVVRAGFRPDSTREALKMALRGRRADFEAFPTRIRPKSGPEARFPARKH